MTDQELLDRYFLARILWWRQNIINLEDAAIMELVATLNEVRLEIGNELALFDWEKERLEALAAYCDDVITAATVKTAQVVSSATVSAGAASLTNWATMLSVGGTAANISFVEMSPAQIKSWFQDTPLGGHSLNEWVKKAFDEGIRKELLTSLRKSGVKGEGYGPMVKNLMQTALDNGAELTERNAITIARTYTQTANVEAQRAVYKQNTDVVYAQKWTSVLDNRVCPRCAALDGVVYKNGEEMPAIPLHPRCRCLLLPCVRVDELGVTSEDLERVARPWVVREPGNIDAGGTRKILLHGSSKEDFGGWYKTLPENERVRIVGPVRARLLEEGKISFGELVDKKTGRLRTLAELGYSESGKMINQFEAAGQWIKTRRLEIERGGFASRGEICEVGKIGSSIIGELSNQGITLDSEKITLMDKGLIHALRDKKPDKIPAFMWDNLPALIQNPQGIYLNLRNNALVYEVAMDRTKAKLVIQLNYDTKIKEHTTTGTKRKSAVINNLRTGATLKNNDELLNRGMYKKLK